MYSNKYISSSGSVMDFYWKIFVTTVILLKANLVSSVAEDYYNPDYDEADEILNTNNWSGILPEHAAKRHMGALARNSGRTSSNLIGNEMGILPSSRGLKFARVVKSEHGTVLGDNTSFLHRLVDDNPRTLFGISTAGDVEWNDGSFDQEELNSNSFPQFMETEAAGVKGKRFLGALARGGWFPRQFRGVVEPQWDKRHIGSAARLGWMPYKMNRKNDGDYKRNIGSLRKTGSKVKLHR